MLTAEFGDFYNFIKSVQFLLFMDLFYFTGYPYYKKLI